MKKCLSFLLLIFCFSTSQSQNTWSDNIAQIVYDNCTSCHNPDGIAPFSLMTWTDAEDVSSSIAEAVAEGAMPPWTADTEYQSYAHERVLEADEITAIVDWVANGAPIGIEAEIPPPPVYSGEGIIQAVPDLEVQIEPYTSQASEWSDDYVCITLPLGLNTDKKLRAFEVVPGNSGIVHHALAYIVPGGSYPTDLSGYCGGPNDGLIGGYAPGSPPTVFPSDGEDFNLGFTIPAGSDLILALHYPEGSAGEVDDTKVRMYFYDDEVVIRDIITDPIISNWLFNIEANTIEEVTADFSFIPIDFSLLSVFPHMHLLGQTIESWAVTPDDEVIPFVLINEWDFEWQEFLFFSQVQVVPAWSTIYGTGTYDNTSNNPDNPNDPPQDIGAGLNTTDEMFLVYFHYLPYESGDELLDLAELTQLPTELTEIQPLGQTAVSTYPNPFVDQIQFDFENPTGEVVSLYIYDTNGKLIEKIADRKGMKSGHNQLTWQPDKLKSGLYYYSLRVGKELSSGVVQHLSN